MDNLKEERINASIDFFVSLKKLCDIYSLDQAMDIMNIYFKTNDEKYITTEYGIRDFVVSSNIREKLSPVIESYNGSVYDYIDSITKVESNSYNK